VAKAVSLKHLPRLIGKSGKKSGKKVARKVAKFMACIDRLKSMPSGYSFNVSVMFKSGKKVAKSKIR